MTGIIYFEGTTGNVHFPEDYKIPAILSQIKKVGQRKVGKRSGHGFWRTLEMSGKCCMSKGNLSGCFMIGFNFKLVSGLQMIWNCGREAYLGEGTSIIILVLDLLNFCFINLLDVLLARLDGLVHKMAIAHS